MPVPELVAHRGYALRYPDISLAGLAMRQGTLLAVYNVADPRVALALAARGVHFIETFSISEMRAALVLPHGRGRPFGCSREILVAPEPSCPPRLVTLCGGKLRPSAPPPRGCSPRCARPCGIPADRGNTQQIQIGARPEDAVCEVVRIRDRARLLPRGPGPATRGQGRASSSTGRRNAIIQPSIHPRPE